jgi:hypothetical protein
VRGELVDFFFHMSDRTFVARESKRFSLLTCMR